MKRSLESCGMSVLGKRDGFELVRDVKRRRVPLVLVSVVMSGGRCERCRVDENGALQRMLADAYSEIHKLREELKQLKWKWNITRGE